MNELLSPNDRVELLSTDDMNGVPVGTKGTVLNCVKVQGKMVYGMKWDNGRTLNLVEGGDEWKKIY